MTDSKYDKIKVLKEVKARITHECDNCGKIIQPTEKYRKEDLGRVHAPHSIKLRSFCTECYAKYGNALKSMKKTSVVKGPLDKF